MRKTILLCFIHGFKVRYWRIKDATSSLPFDAACLSFGGPHCEARRLDIRKEEC
jgi:hypothetical protein